MNKSRMQYSSGSETLTYSVTQRNSIERTDVLKDISNLSVRLESSFCVSKKLELKLLDIPATEQCKYQSPGFKESGQKISSRQSSLKERQTSFHESSLRRVQIPESTKIVNNEPSSATNKSVNQKGDVKMHNPPRYSRTRSGPNGKTDRTPPRFLSRDIKSYPSGYQSNVNDSFLPQSANPVPNQACPGRYPERRQLIRNVGYQPNTGRLQTSHSPLDRNDPSKNTRPDLHNMKSQQWQVPPPSLRREDISQRSGTAYNTPMPPNATNSTPIQYKQGSSYCNTMPPITTSATPVQYKQGSSYFNPMPPITTNATPIQYKKGSSYCKPMPYFGKNTTPVQYKQGSSYFNPMPPSTTNAIPVQYKKGSSYCNPMPYFGKNANPVQYKQGASYRNPMPNFGKNATPMRYKQGSVDYTNATPIRPAKLSTCYQNTLFPEKIQPLQTITSNAPGGINQFPDVVQGRQDLKIDQDLTPPLKDTEPGMQDLETDKDLKPPVLQPPKDIVTGIRDLKTDQDLKSTALQLQKDTVSGRQDLKTDQDLTQPQKDLVLGMQDLKTNQELKPPSLQAQKDVEPWRQNLKTDQKEPNALQPEKDIVPGKKDLKVDQDLKPTALENQKDIVPGRQNLETDQDLKPLAIQPQEDIVQDRLDLETDQDLKPLALQPQEDIVQDRQYLETDQDLKAPALQPEKDLVPGRQDLKTNQDSKPPVQQPQKDIVQDRLDLETDQDLKPHVQQHQEDIVPGRQDLKTDQDLKPPALHNQESKTKGADNCNTLCPKRGIYEKKEVQAFAERAHYSKKNMLKVNIPKTPPPTSYIPVHATLGRGLFIGQVQTNVIKFPPPLGSGHFGSSFAEGRRIIPHLPYQAVGFCTQTQVCSNFHPAVTHQAISRTPMQNNMLIHSVANAVNPMHPSTQTQTMPTQMVQYQSATQNLNPALPYQDLNNPIYPYGTQYPAIQNIAAESQYQDPNHPMYQYGTQHQPTHMQSTDSQYQNLNDPIYQYGTQYPPNIAANSQYQDPNHSMYQYGGQYQPMYMQSADSQYQDPNYLMHQYGMEYQPMHIQSANSQYQDPNLLMYQSGTQYGPPIQDVNAEFQYQDPNLAMYQYGANSSSETFRPPQAPWSHPTYDTNTPSQEQNLNMLPMQTYATNPDSESTIQYPTWPDRSADQSYHMTDYLNLLPNFSGEQTPVENPSSISVSEYPSGFQAGNELTSHGTNHYQGNMSIENPEVMYTKTYTKWSDATSDSHAKKSDNTSNNQ